MPWKNGLGVTSEIAIQPKGADYTQMEFDWRISSAQVAKANSFSCFPNYDRILTVVSGQGLRLNAAILKSGDIYRFAGEEPIDCQLIDDAVVDVGIIYKRGQFAVNMSIHEFSNDSHFSDIDGVCFMLPLNEGAVLDGHKFGNSDTYRIQGRDTVKIQASVYPFKILVISIRSISEERHA